MDLFIPASVYIVPKASVKLPRHLELADMKSFLAHISVDRNWLIAYRSSAQRFISNGHGSVISRKKGIYTYTFMKGLKRFNLKRKQFSE